MQELMDNDVAVLEHLNIKPDFKHMMHLILTEHFRKNPDMINQYAEYVHSVSNIPKNEISTFIRSEFSDVSINTIIRDYLNNCFKNKSKIENIKMRFVKMPNDHADEILDTMEIVS